MAQVRTRKRGKTFSYIFEAGKTSDGKRKVVEKGGYPTKAEAYKAGVEAFNDHLHGNIGITSDKITLKNFMTAWLENVVAHEVKATTLRHYMSETKNHVYPTLGDIAVQDLTPAVLDKWIRKLFTDGYAYNSIVGVHSILAHALKYAVYPAQLISSNPAAFIDVPKKAPRQVVKRHIITPEQFNDLLKKFPFGSPMYIPLLLLYHTGMRLGEVLGLSWSDVDFAAKKITLRRQLVYVSKRGYCLTTLKTKSSTRDIIIGDFLLGELRRWQAQQADNEKILGDNYICLYLTPDNFIVQQSKSVPTSAEKISLICISANGKLFLRGYIIKTLKDEGFNAHSFRHTHATRLIENGAPAKGVAGRLGHSNILITQNLYTHNTIKLQEETAMIFDNFLQTN